MPEAVRIEPFSVVEHLTRHDDLLMAHWDEIVDDKALMRVNPDAAAYQALEAAGMLLALGAFRGDEMLGYSVGVMSRHLHHADVFLLHNDLLFVAPAHRKGTLGLRLIRETEQAAKAAGAALVLWYAKQGTTLEALLPRIGYGVQEITFSRRM